MSGAPSASSGPAANDTLHVNEFSAQILDNTRTPMRMYGIRVDDRTAEAYVEAKEGEQFSVRLNSSNRSHTFAAVLKVAGQHFGSYLCPPPNWPRFISDRSCSESEAQTLLFSKVVVTDDEMNSINDPAEVARLGEILIELRKVASHQPSIVPKFPVTDLGPEKAIYERAKKVGAIQSGAGPIVQRPYSARSSWTHDATFQTISFKVQSSTRVGLQQLGHIPKDEEVPSASSIKKRSREEEKIEAEKKRLRSELERLENRSRVLQEAGSSRGTGTSTQDGEVSVSVKNERRAFDFSSRGTADDPLTIADLSD
ncbi:unnamed protein product [Tilletia controversa]|uniref:DUF7918 domain-containing protein n=4 Tax=Tilletia TaxID=13289 RepID=A0A8X7T132_9BASI|nr:hypothetical protein CF336_g6175 [Tilletia laevis]KAE8190684.1 hypothetical protein CF328_g5903 [Tilletia controversa]CAD6918598.1 unnamed protein product [Tilletia caries]KAE8255306.1 hypothetical protein A4X06_0g488 [Tilletia controversa]CAD6897491.1 unnamed protein product [Tilletia laevis]